MSLLPYLFDDSALWRTPGRRTWLGVFDDDDDAFQPIPLRSLKQQQSLLRNLSAALQETGSQVTVDKNKFQANFDVQHFKPDEICVKVSGDSVTIEGKHEEKQDEHGQIYRHFVRKYTLPKDCDPARLESKLSSDGVLTISAPRIGDQTEQRSIPITRTGQPAKSIEQPPKKEE